MEDNLQKVTKIQLTELDIKRLPEESGVYIFWRANTINYIGKAKNIKARVSSYFNLNLDPKTTQMISASDSLSFIKVTSELESLLLEAHLIRTQKPKYNTISKDDKNPLYIKITKEEFPRILSVRKQDLIPGTSMQVFGPFPSSLNVKRVLRMIRRIFPFSDHKIGKRACIESHMGLCDPCPSVINHIAEREAKLLLKRKYMRNIGMIRKVLSRQVNPVLKSLQLQMSHKSSNRDFEEAAEIRDKINRLNYITQPIIPKEMFLENPNLSNDIKDKELTELESLLTTLLGRINLARIECFDVSHLAGVAPTASMVVFIDGVPDKSHYRHFRINQKKGNDDISSMKEVIRRRVKHFEDWGTPDMIVVDGGKTQVQAFLDSISRDDIKIVGLAKRLETLVIPQRGGKTGFTELRIPAGNALNLLQRIRDEAHRFARRYHHHLLKKRLIPVS